MSLLYHYCSTETFVSIVTSRTIRLSSLTLSNDSQEGAVIRDVLLKLANESEINPYALQRLEKQLRSAYEFFDGLGFCLSEREDLLSQWRGYADDGRGVCIGFNSQYLEKLGKTRKDRDEKHYQLRKLIYDQDGQREIAAEYIEDIKKLLDQGAFKSTLGSILVPMDDERREKITKATEAGYFAILRVMLRMFEIKNPAFYEEQEWRLISFSTTQLDELETKFRACSDKIVPYLEVKIEELDLNPVGRVILGPKHNSPHHVVERLLHNYGFKSVEISNSSATYR